MSDRRKLTRTEREEILTKMNGHCAYCGCELEYKDMQADHVDPLRRGGDDETGNMFPACRSCNHYKSSMTLDGFRKMLERMPDALMRDSVTYKNAVRFGLVTPTPHKVIFYFERKEGAYK